MTTRLNGTCDNHYLGPGFSKLARGKDFDDAESAIGGV